MADSSSVSVVLGQSSGGVTYTAGAGITITGSALSVSDPIVPTDGTQNFTGAVAASATVRGTGLSAISTVAAANVVEGYAFGSPLGDNTSISLRVQGQNVVTALFNGNLSLVPYNGSTITGYPVVVTGVTDQTQLKVIANATQTTNLIQFFASNGTTNLFLVTSAGAVTIGSDFTVLAGKVVAFDVAQNNIIGKGIAGVANNLFLRSAASDGAGAIGFQSRVSTNLTTAGALVANWENNNGTQVSAMAYDGAYISPSTRMSGQITLNVDGVTAGTATVLSGSICVIGDQSGGVANPAFSVSGTTLTVSNSVANAGHVINYICIGH